MSDVRFIRRNGRIIPIKGKSANGGNKKQSEFQKAPVTTGLKKGAKFGAIFGASTGALAGLTATGLISGAGYVAGKLDKADDIVRVSKIAALAGVAGVTPLLAGAGAIRRGIQGAVIGTGVGLAYSGYKSLKKRKK